MLGRIGHLKLIWNHEFPRHIHWIPMLDDLITFSLNTFDSATSFMEKKDDSTVGAWTNVVIHTFLTERPLLDDQPCVETVSSHASNHREATILEACRLGVLLYMIPVWRFFGVSPVVSEVLVNNARSILDKNKDIDWGDYLWPLKLWVLYVAGVEAVSNPVNRAWFAASISHIIIEKQLKNWDRAMEVVKIFLWFECLFKGYDEDLKRQVSEILE
ncbi:hypothetical protein EIK77_000175 [Talaromyces pinophilus]|nr:hypothetical protein EIK77_000175 [Talaromyces pinophilus]